MGPNRTSGKPAAPSGPGSSHYAPPQQVNHVAALGQVWGLLKYFYPAVAAGQRDWDATFLRQLPAVLARRSVAERSQLLRAWLTSLGTVPACGRCATLPAQPVRQQPDWHWNQARRRFSLPLRQQLAQLAANPAQDSAYYVQKAPAGKPTFYHEQAYADQPCPPLALRLLAVCRYWNQVQYFCPYRQGLTPAWPATLSWALARFAAATTPLACWWRKYLIEGDFGDA